MSLNLMINQTERDMPPRCILMPCSENHSCPINAALNYGYSIVLSVFNREITANGYLTQLGLFHDNMFNQYNLSCDLMEPFRPFVDIAVKDMNPHKFEKE